MKNLCEQAALYFYGELDAQQEAAFRTHLENCPACQRELAFLKQTQAALVAPAAPAQLVEQVLGAQRKTNHWWRQVYKYAWVAVVVLAVGVGGFFGRAVWQQNSSAATQGWVAYVSDEIDNEYYNFAAEFEAFENDF